MKRVVFITGASSGFGQAIARHLASKAFKVYGTSRRAAPGTSASSCHMLKMDVRDRASIEAAAGQILDREGRIDVLVNNAGISMVGPLEAASMEDVNDVFDTNVNGVLRTCQAVLPIMRHQKSGLVINISSIGGLIGLPYRGLYSASKFALEGLTEALSMELKPFGVHVCLVEPGDFNTNIGLNRKKAALAPDSVYRETCDAIQAVVEKQLANANSPAVMGGLIEKIISARTPRLRYKLGTWTEKISPAAKQILPGRLFEKIILSFYGLS
jgi:NAD(P)-dependent dehydrogenase (short-subunit alcohol dehydrogenase family)